MSCWPGFGAPIWSMNDSKESLLRFPSGWRAVSSSILRAHRLCVSSVMCSLPAGRQAGRHSRLRFREVGWLVWGHAARAELKLEPVILCRAPVLPFNVMNVLETVQLHVPLFLWENVFQIPTSSLWRISVTQACCGLEVACSGLGEEVDTQSVCPDSCNQISPSAGCCWNYTFSLGQDNFKNETSEMLSLFSQLC